MRKTQHRNHSHKQYAETIHRIHIESEQNITIFTVVKSKILRELFTVFHALYIQGHDRLRLERELLQVFITLYSISMTVTLLMIMLWPITVPASSLPFAFSYLTDQGGQQVVSCILVSQVLLAGMRFSRPFSVGAIPWPPLLLAALGPLSFWQMTWMSYLNRRLYRLTELSALYFT